MCSLRDPVSIFTYVTSNVNKIGTHFVFIVSWFGLNVHAFASMLYGDPSTVPGFSYPDELRRHESEYDPESISNVFVSDSKSLQLLVDTGLNEVRH